jgi:hypothetical protein
MGVLFNVAGFQMSNQTDGKILISASKFGSGEPSNGGIKISLIIQ